MSSSNSTLSVRPHSSPDDELVVQQSNPAAASLGSDDEARWPDSVEQMVQHRTQLRRSRWRRTVQPYLVLSDLIVVALSALLVAGWWPEILAMAIGVPLVLGSLGIYRSRLTLSVLDDLPTIAVAALVGGVGELAWRTSLGGDVSASSLLSRIAVVTALLACARAVAYGVVRHARRVGLVRHRTLILGAGEVGRQIASAALAHPEYGLLPIGFLDSEAAEAAVDHDSLPVPVLGDYAELAHHIRHEKVSEVIVAFTGDGVADSSVQAAHDAELVDAVRACDRMDCEIFSVPRFFELHHRSRDMDELWGISLVRARRATWRSGSWQVKRMIDVVVAGLALVLLSPLLLAIAIAVRIENGPGVLFHQERVGLDGHLFTLLKFRSLRLPEGPDAPAVWSINGDARLGPVGRLIRATSLDELPQLINILRGDMSVVGPRPERPAFVEEFTAAIPRYTARHRAPAGLTGWAQVNGLRGDTSIEERARFDNYYIQNWSLWLDAKIIARTVSSVLFRRGS